jgi:hypothetical protein
MTATAPAVRVMGLLGEEAILPGVWGPVTCVYGSVLHQNPPASRL